MELHNQIINADCIKVLKKFPDNVIDMTITSPPYYNAKLYSKYQSVENYMDQMRLVFKEVFRCLKPSRICVIVISPVIVPRESRSTQSYRIPLPFYFVPMMEKLGFEFLDDIIWKKPDGSALNRNGGFFQHRKPIAYKPNIVTEYILVFKKKADFLIDKILQNRSLVEDGYERTNVWKINPDTKSKHPAPFPEEIPNKCIRYYSYEGDLILDPFAGSGTTGLACINTNRSYILIEKEKKYCDIILRRLNGLYE